MARSTDCPAPQFSHRSYYNIQLANGLAGGVTKQRFAPSVRSRYHDRENLQNASA
jgi:hypothetical protein